MSGGGPAAGEPFGVPGAEDSQITVESQLLTVTSEGVWVDGERTDVARQQPLHDMYLRPEGTPREQGARSSAAGAKRRPGRPRARERCPRNRRCSTGAASPGAAGPGPYGQRVITGLSEGVTLRLQGEDFQRVLSIGGESPAAAVPGQLYGAAFGSPNEGWLGFQRAGAPDERRRTVQPRTTGRSPRAIRWSRSRPSPARPWRRAGAKRSPSARAAASPVTSRARVAARKPVRTRRADRKPLSARCRLAAGEPHLRRRRRRGNVAVARRNGTVGTRSGDADQLPRQPLRDRLRPRKPGARLRRRRPGGRPRWCDPALRQDLDRRNAASPKK